MGRTEFLTLTIRSEPRLESANQPRERNGALQQECMHSCAHTVIDTADIVRDGDFSPTMSARRPQLTALVLHVGVDFHLERSKVLKRNSQKSLSPEAGIATGKSTSSLVLGTLPFLRNGLSPHRAVACDSYFAGTERSSRRAPFLAT